MSLLSEIPDFIDAELWSDFEQHRIEIKHKMTPLAKKYLIKKLTAWHLQGMDVNECIVNSIANGWQGVFEVEQKKEKLPKEDRECIVFGAQRGIDARPGESMWDYRQRLQAAL